MPGAGARTAPAGRSTDGGLGSPAPHQNRRHRANRSDSDSSSLITDSDDPNSSSGSAAGGPNRSDDSDSEDDWPDHMPDAEDLLWDQPHHFEAEALRARVDALAHLDGGKGGPPNPKSTGPRGSRAQLRLAVAVLRARLALVEAAYDSLAQALQDISASVPRSTAFERPSAATDLAQSRSSSFGLFVPVLARLAQDVRRTLVEGEPKGREYRRTHMSKESAAAHVRLKQRWVTGKGKAKAGDSDWSSVVLGLVEKHPPPEALSDPRFATQTTALLNSLEQAVLPSALPRISLAGCGLDTRLIRSWKALERARDVLEWYFSFAVGTAEQARACARQVLYGIKALDLSRNRLDDLPSFLPTLFPNLDSLTLSNNAFTRLPPSITLFASLRRLRLHGNRLARSRRALECRENRRRPAEASGDGPVRINVPRVRQELRQALLTHPAAAFVPSGTRLPSLFSLSAELAHLHLSADEWEGNAALATLPLQLSDAITDSYHCLSCGRFVLPTSPLFVGPFWERWHHLDPGVSLPRTEAVQANVTTRRRQPRAGPSEDAAHMPDDRDPHSPPDGRRPATLDQRIWLALLARPFPDIRDPRSPSTAEGVSTQRRPAAAKPRESFPPTLVIGGRRPLGRGYRFCALCAACHLEMETILREMVLAAVEEGEEGVGERIVQWRCRCFVCEEERRVRNEREEGHEDGTTHATSSVLRWYRRKDPV